MVNRSVCFGAKQSDVSEQSAISEVQTLIKTQDSYIHMENNQVSLRRSPVSGRRCSRAILQGD
ncbi:TPA: hypothetical protein OPR08_003487 [Citrobacter koseri]|uniref:hypothetical protein n=1 Tax=Citrobacter koseri TaxID=545 RepID=UPI00101EEB7B|nr:hypothetical protein [Citrobacter koseri]MBJ8985737.1 hypothetical protein [Citrobacter koseri]MBJ9281291.1 hypothetical protein [Citrobacter koseri]MDE9577733.1 hypothetical protein [Citrobacter koseri]RZA58730.1 hypothetical protein EVX99_20365 [Citrobacter koseri]HAT3723434.1 hypothetical protein [Citrobacter koseri]